MYFLSLVFIYILYTVTSRVPCPRGPARPRAEFSLAVLVVVVDHGKEKVQNFEKATLTLEFSIVCTKH